MKYVNMTHSNILVETVENSVFNQKKLKSGVKEMKKPKEIHNIDGDVYVNLYSRDCAYLAAGASIEACKAVYQEQSA